MSQSHVLRLAVLDREDQRLIGIVSAADLAGGASEGRPCEVIFHRMFRDHYGHARQGELMCVTIAQRTKQEAIATAIRQFEQVNEASSWNDLAGEYSVTSIHVNKGGATVEDHELTSQPEARVLCRAREL
jgi:CBS domain-containing protein